MTDEEVNDFVKRILDKDPLAILEVIALPTEDLKKVTAKMEGIMEEMEKGFS